jgi:predicted transcriptional regulator
MNLTIPSFRALDPMTSVLAAERAEKFKASHAERILSALKENGPASASKLQALTGLTIVQIDRRTIELQRAGLIEVVIAGGQPLTAGGCRVWRANS